MTQIGSLSLRPPKKEPCENTPLKICLGRVINAMLPLLKVNKMPFRKQKPTKHLLSRLPERCPVLGPALPAGHEQRDAGQQPWKGLEGDYAIMDNQMDKKVLDDMEPGMPYLPGANAGPLHGSIARLHVLSVALLKLLGSFICASIGLCRQRACPGM